MKHYLPKLRIHGRWRLYSEITASNVHEAMAAFQRRYPWVIEINHKHGGYGTIRWQDKNNEIHHGAIFLTDIDAHEETH